MTLWLIDRNQSHYRLTDRFAPAFYVSRTGLTASSGSSRRSQANHRASPADSPSARTCGRTRRARSSKSPVARPTQFHRLGTMGAQARLAIAALQQRPHGGLAVLLGEALFPLACVEVEADDEGKILALECRDDEWALDYEMPPLEIMQIRLAGLSRIDPTHGRRAALEIEMDGTCWELDETGEPPAVGSQRLLKRHDPDVILSEWGDSTILPLLAPAGRTARVSLAAQSRSRMRKCSECRARSYTSYGRILFKAAPPRSSAASTWTSRIPSFRRSATSPASGNWRASPSFPIQYAARTTTGTGISYMQMELAYRDGVLIPEQKAEPEDPKPPDELLVADRGGLVFVPKIGFHANVAELDFVSQYPEHHGAVQYLARDRQLPVLPRCAARSRTGLPHLPEAARHHEPRGRTAHRQAMRTQEAARRHRRPDTALSDTNCSAIR